MIIKIAYERDRDTPYKAGEYVFVRSNSSRQEEKVFTARLESDYEPFKFQTVKVRPVPSIGTKNEVFEVNSTRIIVPASFEETPKSVFFGYSSSTNWTVPAARLTFRPRQYYAANELINDWLEQRDNNGPDPEAQN